MISSPHLFGTLSLLAATTALAGCGSSKPKEYDGPVHPVKGKVLFAGAPLKMGTVNFYPDETKGNTAPAASGMLQPDGSYTLRLSGKEGAAPGWYKVTISGSGMPATMPQPGEKMPEAAAIPKRYSDREKTPFSIEVTPEPKAGAYDLSVAK